MTISPIEALACDLNVALEAVPVGLAPVVTTDYLSGVAAAATARVERERREAMVRETAANYKESARIEINRSRLQAAGEVLAMIAQTDPMRWPQTEDGHAVLPLTINTYHVTVDGDGHLATEYGRTLKNRFVWASQYMAALATAAFAVFLAPNMAQASGTVLDIIIPHLHGTVGFVVVVVCSIIMTVTWTIAACLGGYGNTCVAGRIARRIPDSFLRKAIGLLTFGLRGSPHQANTPRELSPASDGQVKVVTEFAARELQELRLTAPAGMVLSEPEPSAQSLQAFSDLYR